MKQKTKPFKYGCKTKPYQVRIPTDHREKEAIKAIKKVMKQFEIKKS